MRSKNFIEIDNYLKNTKYGEIFMQGRIDHSAKHISASLPTKAICQVLSVWVCLLLLTTSLFAQDPSNPKRGLSSGASYSISDIETINTTNGNLMLNIPLAGLPKGRGEVGNSISLMYNSKLFDTTVEEALDQSQQMSFQNFLKGSSDGGWHYVTNSYSLDVISRFDYGLSWFDCNGSGFYAGKNHYSMKVVMHMPDGSKKEFRPTGFSDIYDDGFFDVMPSGYNTSSCSSGETLYSSSGMVYYSTDGSYTKLVVDYVSNPTARGEGNPWTLYLPDGSKITKTSTAIRKYDRNGNYVEGFTDNFGRSISLQKNVNPNEDHVTMQGVNNETLTWKVFWKTITVNKQYSTTGSVFGIGQGGTSTQTFYDEIKVVDQIILPTQLDSLTYEFHYNTESGGTGWGEVSSITMPSGAEVEYSYNTPFPVNTDKVLLRHITSKALTYLEEYDGSSNSVTDTWTYSIGKTSSTVTAPDGSWTTQYYGDTSYENLMNGLVRKTVNSNGSISEQIWAFNRPPGANTTAPINAYVKTSFMTISDYAGNPSLTAIKDFTIDPNGNQTQVKEYDWVSYSSVPKDSNGYATGIPTGATLKRTTTNTYNNSATSNSSNGYWSSSSPNVRNAISRTEIAGVSVTEITYDNPSTTANPVVVRNWDSTKGATSNPLTTSNSIAVTTQYNSYGMPTLVTDAKGNQTQITYGSITTPTGSVSDLYPTQTKTAYGTSIQRNSTAVYDFFTGLVTSETDADNNVTSTTEYDSLGRPTKAAAAVGTSSEIWTTTEYDDDLRRIITRSDVAVKGDGKKISVQHFDQLGRVRLSRMIENWATEDPEDEADGIKVQTRFMTSGGYNYQLTSNPYRAATSAQASGEPSMGWTRSKTVNTGKHSEIETFSGSVLPAPFTASNPNTNSTGIVTTDIDAERTLVTDQAGKQRISKTNGLGQMTDVWEIVASSDSATVSVTFPGTSIAYGYQTGYSYDTLNNLSTVTQGSQTRTFSYSSLSRLLTAQNPESGSISYQYDNNGNLTQKTDARSVVTSYSYDALNRVLTRSYSDGTPQVTYTYDDSGVAYSKGKLTKVSSSVSATEYTGFDILGRVLSHKQVTDGYYYTTAYSYDLSGALLEETYPSGRKVKNTFDAEGDLSKVETQKAGGSWQTRADNFSYTASGAVSSMQYGNGRWESAQFNSRLQPVQIALGTTQNASDLLKLEYSYGTTQNNGNLQSQTITVPTTGGSSGFTAVQAYTYDSLNRLKSATETVSSNQTWKQTFNYDRYGNRNFDTGNTTTLGSCSTAVCNPTVSTSDNRFTSGQGYSYDLSGNIIADAEGRSFYYDAENKQKEVKDINTVTIGTYLYDGDGKRVKKVSDQETTIFVYDASGKMVAEYAVSISQSPQISYLTQDHLGSPRVITDQNGSVTSRRDFHPFGEEVFTSQRVSGLGYTADEIRQKFTSYERDNESSLDFAKARYYGYNYGRFASPDRPLLDQSSSDPQSWNLYVYAGNSPLKFTDPLGLWKRVKCEGFATQCWEAEEGDTFESLAEILHLDAENLREFFQNQEIVEGRVFDVSGYDAWRRQGDWYGKMAKDDLSDMMRNGPPMGGLNNVSKVAKSSGLFRWFGRQARKFGRWTGIIKPKQVATVAELAAKQLVGSSGKEMLRDAVNIVKAFKGTPQQKAELFEEFTKQIAQRTGGAWSSSPGLATLDGGKIFVGTGGHALVIDSAGNIFTGPFSAGGWKVTTEGYKVIYENLKKID